MSKEASDVESPEVTEDEIRLRAYQIYRAPIARGQLGNSQADWCEAQAQLETLSFLRPVELLDRWTPSRRAEYLPTSFVRI